MAAKDDKQNVQMTMAKLFGFSVVMFAFAIWVMPPLYDLFCEVTGLNGKTKGKYEAVAAEVDTSRTVTVQFVTINNDSMPWGFKPKEFSVDVHPGEAVNTYFIARNPTKNVMIAQAIPSLAPKNATDYFHKTECFCFNSQTLEPGEEAELGLQFIVDQDLPRGVKTITLSYSLFDITDMMPAGEKAKADTSQAANHINEPLIITAKNL
ncbi:cytochrome c oxidase assembly protein [Agarilytica rhodophyticola]|uniref:cytochrome c oxidase assembly protein n=1 Tax=Agarilytica rhodophyticola TaxID=1737490 RepID=UPI000B343FD3|nr:cytochrome c oxidase assembly protein [Agarilytica rhodophyticola]